MPHNRSMDGYISFSLLGFVGACFLASLSGAFFRPGEWYERMAKPWWRPPNWLFAPAWSIIYLTIAVAGWLVWRIAGFSGAGFALAIYFVSLLFNACWSALFFGMRRPDWAFFEAIGLWLSIAATIWAFSSIDADAAWLLLPYLAWVTFATYLNFVLWRMNRIPARPLAESN